VCYSLGINVKQKVSGSYASAEAAMEGYAKNGWKVSGTDKSPLPGYVVFFHFSGEHAGANHTGIVVDHDAGGIHTVEGNTSDGPGGSQVNGGGVYRRYRPWSVIIGYGKIPGVSYGSTAAAKAPSAGKTYPTLKVGMGTPKAPDARVKRMQGLLHIAVDGVFGPKTQATVKAYQTNHHLVSDGVAGPATLRVLGY
jgi:peptidoglycan hydrolase-like protein with peptidoglycan-binding domain